MTNRNEIYLRRKNKIIISAGNADIDSNSIVYVATFIRNIQNLGYTLSKEVIEVLLTLENKSVVNYYNLVVPTLKKMVGANKKYKPMYPNFPAQVMEASEAELYINAIMHYMGDLFGVRIIPEYLKKVRTPLLDDPKLTVINLGSNEDFQEMFLNIISSKTSISETDKEDVKWFLDVYKNLLPVEIPHKEILAFIAAEVYLRTKSIESFSKYFKGATDVLRLAVGLSAGDVSLATDTKFRNFKRSERRMLISLLEECGSKENIIEDMLRYKKIWIRLGEKIHPNEYALTVPKSVYAFNVLRNNVKFQTFKSHVEVAIEEMDVITASELLVNRPGEMARRLDKLLRDSQDENTKSLIINRFSIVSEKVSTPVLLQVISHFKNRNDKQDRTFFPKGNIAKLQIIPNDLAPISSKTNLEVVNVCEKALRERFSKLESLGKVYVDPSLKSYLVPFSQRSASRSVKTLVRGSRVALEEGNTIRFFIWWKNEETESKASRDDYYTEGRVDLDLSALMYGDNFTDAGIIAYYNLRNNDVGMFHSGDITSAPNGACEFIDIDIQKCINRKIRYIAMNVNCFTGQKYVDLPECFAGWMVRSKPNSGEIFEAKTVQDKVDLTVESKMSIPLIIDLFNREVIWVDMANNASGYSCINVRNNKQGLDSICRAMVNLKKPNLYDLFMLHAQARGSNIVTEIADADSIFSANDAGGITPFDTEEIMSKYL